VQQYFGQLAGTPVMLDILNDRRLFCTPAAPHRAACQPKRI
jgi:hypothetical protein